MTLPTHNHNATDTRIGTTTEPGQIYRQFHLTDRIFRSNRVHIGGTATSRNQFATQIITRWIDLRDQGIYNRAVVVIDPTRSLPKDVFRAMSPAQQSQTAIIDLNHPERPSDLNLINPLAFPDRNECVNAIITAYKPQSTEKMSVAAC